MLRLSNKEAALIIQIEEHYTCRHAIRVPCEQSVTQADGEACVQVCELTEACSLRSVIGRRASSCVKLR